jgi:hypothetical protein
MKAELVLCIALLSASASCQSQPTTTATTPGKCSVSNTGSNNTFTINCRDDKAQGQAILKIVNEILAHQLDTNTVMSKLDELEQVMKNSALHWKLEPAKVDTLTSAFKANVSPGCVVSVATDSDSKDLATQLCEAGRTSNRPMPCMGPGFGNVSTPLLNSTNNAGVVGLGCYADAPKNASLLAVRKSLATVGLECEYKGTVFKVGQLSLCTGGPSTTVVVGNMPAKSK